MTEKPKIEFGQAARQYVTELNGKEALVRRIFREVLLDPRKGGSTTDFPFTDHLLELISEHAPPFIDALGFGSEIRRVNSPWAWLALFPHTSLPRYTIERPLDSDDPDSPILTRDDKGFVMDICQSNDRFFMPYTLSIASSVFGEEMAEGLRGFPDPGNPQANFGAAELAEQFGPQPETPVEVLQRLQLVFPTRSSSQTDFSGYEALAKKHAFRRTEKDDDGVEAELKCPAPTIANVVHETLGEVLRNKRFQRRFLRNITTSPTV